MWKEGRESARLMMRLIFRFFGLFFLFEKLLSFKKQQQPPSPSSSVDPELTLREAGQISLSLAVSSAFAGGLGIQVAGSEEFLALAPRWCKVSDDFFFCCCFC